MYLPIYTPDTVFSSMDYFSFLLSLLPSLFLSPLLFLHLGNKTLWGLLGMHTGMSHSSWCSSSRQGWEKAWRHGPITHLSVCPRTWHCSQTRTCFLTTEWMDGWDVWIRMAAFQFLTHSKGWHFPSLSIAFSVSATAFEWERMWFSCENWHSEALYLKARI